MEYDHFGDWFLDKYGDDEFRQTGFPPEYTELDTKWLRSAVAGYSFHLQLCAWLNIPLGQWLLLVIGILVGLIAVQLMVLCFLAQRIVLIKRTELWLFKKIGKIQEKVLNNRDKTTGAQQNSVSSTNCSSRSSQRHNSTQGKSSSSNAQRNSKETKQTRAKDQRQRSPSPGSSSKAPKKCSSKNK